MSGSAGVSPDASNSGFQSRRDVASLAAVKTIQPGILEEAVERLKKEFQPEEIYLFGSGVWFAASKFGVEALWLEQGLGQ